MKIGILGAGRIAEHIVNTVKQMPGMTVHAVAARDGGRAQSFAGAHGIPKAYGTYLELAQDEEVELVYVATVHSCHYENVKLCLEHGKNVLCEKAFMMNAKEASEVIELAGRKGVLLAEAIWTRYMPSRGIIDSLLAEGAIGRVTSLTANLGYPVCTKERLMRSELGGGALLDLGVYPVNFALMAFGEDYESVSADAVMADTGVDAIDSITLKWKDGRCAVLHANMLAVTDRLGCIYGEKGYIIVENINNCEQITVFDKDHKPARRISVPEQISGYEYEFLACKKAIEEGRTECEEMPLKSSLKVMELLDEIRSCWGR